jgi:hypothetical protein
MSPKDSAAAFFRAGGTLSWKEWTSASTTQQDAWVQGQEVVRVEEAFRLAAALSGPDGLADVVSVIHPGLPTRLALLRAVEKASGRQPD